MDVWWAFVFSVWKIVNHFSSHSLARSSPLFSARYKMGGGGYMHCVFVRSFGFFSFFFFLFLFCVQSSLKVRPSSAEAST